MIKLEHVSKSFDGGQSFSVKEVSFDVSQGETLVLLGSSGCGKSTTLKMINHLIAPTLGRILINNQDVEQLDPVKLRRSIGYVFQGSGLFPHMTVAENVSIVLRLEGKSVKQQQQRARELLTFVDLDPNEYADRYPDELSGGQQQRVGVARALANESNILLMDEPFGALDSITRDALQQDLLKLKKRLNMTIIFVTHDIFEALRLADQIAVMDQGEIIQIGSKEEIINNPQTAFVEQLFRKPVEQITHYTKHLDD